MLVLTRKPGEKIMVGNNIQVEVVAVDHDTVSFSIQSPRTLTLMPGEETLEPDSAADGTLLPMALTRKTDECILISNEPQGAVEVLVVSVKGEAVRIGIKAPRDVQIHREEIFNMIQRESGSQPESGGPDASGGI